MIISPGDAAAMGITVPDDYRKIAPLGTTEADMMGEFLMSGHPENPNLPAIEAVSRRQREERQSGSSTSSTSSTMPEAELRPKNKADFAYRDADALRRVLEDSDIDYRYNMRSHEHQVLLGPYCTLLNPLYHRNEWIPFDELMQAEVRSRCESHYTYKRSDGKVAALKLGEVGLWRQVLESLAQRMAINDVVDFLLMCEAKWDGITGRAEQYFIETIGAEDTPLNRALFLALLGGAVHRTFEPGAKYDVVPLFIGPDGIGKSTAVRCLLPKNKQNEWFTDAFLMDANMQQQVETILGCMFVEISDMGGKTRAERNKLRGVISRTVDKVRLAFGRMTSRIPRQFVFFATDNDFHCIPSDPQGGLRRRFGPILCNGGMTLKEIISHADANRIQVFGEVMHMYRDGHQFYIDGDLEREMKGIAESHMEQDEEFAEKVRRLYPAPAPLMELAREAEIVTESNPKLGSRDKYRLKEELKRQGWVYIDKPTRWRGHGNRSGSANCWHPTKTDTAHNPENK